MNVEEELRKRRNSVTATINTSLKRQSKFANLDKEITFHWASHSKFCNQIKINLLGSLQLVTANG